MEAVSPNRESSLVPDAAELLSPLGEASRPSSHHADQTPIFSEVLYERLAPTVTPEMGFQSYEYLDGNKETRNKEKAAFLAGDIVNPTLDYPLLDEFRLRMQAAPLDVVMSQAEYLSDPIAAAAVKSSAEYRRDEMMWLIVAKRLNELAAIDPQGDEFLETAALYQEMNESLYGVPNPELVSQVYGEILSQAEEKDLDPYARELYQQLHDGAVIEVAGVQRVIPPLGEHRKDRLPQITKEDLSTLREVLREDYSFVFEAVQSYWDEVVVPRSQSSQEEAHYVVEDMKVLFEQVRAQIDPNHVAGITIAVKENKSALSWDTPTMSVEIGASRLPIESPTEMAAKIIHELVKHGGGAVNGLSSDLPVLGTGLYTDADPEKDERRDYLTFEEGFATLCEMAIEEEEVSWNALHLSRYLACASIYEGADFRGAFEINWRARVLIEAKSGEPVTDAMTSKQRTQADISVTRIKRGTPTFLEDGPVLTFNKDLSYLGGKIRAAAYLKSIGTDKAAIRRLFTAKFDPTNHIQNELVTRYGKKVG